MVSEAGASVYSASAYASRELPGMDVSLRGAVSIARRLQDPLAELVKIDPKSIGVGQYQHDMSESKLSRSLDAVVEDCVNAVGVDVNTASAPLLARVSGISAGLADGIVAHRDAAGPFRSRRALTGVPRLGPEGLRAVRRLPAHPRRRRPARRLQRAPGGLPGGAAHPDRRRDDHARPDRQHRAAAHAHAADFADERFGVPTVTDILRELEKPGRDPRPAFRTAAFAEGVETMADLAPGMLLEGVVTNVAAFGAFVDVGVHQDGLVHVSAMSRNFVADPREVAKPGDVVRVKVLGVDIPRKRISLTLRLDEEPDGRGAGSSSRTDRPVASANRPGDQAAPAAGHGPAATVIGASAAGASAAGASVMVATAAGASAAARRAGRAGRATCGRRDG